MKLTTRMKKILLFLQHPKKVAEWFTENLETNISRKAYSEEWAIVSFCEKKFYLNLTRSVKFSYKRTFTILERYELVNFTWVISHLHPTYYTLNLELTNKGKMIAEKIEGEIRNTIKEYEYLI